VNTEETNILRNIISDCIKNKRSAQEKLYKIFYGYGMSVCLRYAPEKDEAAEILNDSFLKVFANLKQYNFEQDFKPWFRKIIINTSIDYYRKSRQMLYNKDTELHNDINYSSENLHSLNMNDLLLLLSKIPDVYRLTFNLYEIEGYSHDEIADLMKITASTSRSNLTRAKKMLRKEYQNIFQENFNTQNAKTLEEYSKT